MSLNHLEQIIDRHNFMARNFRDNGVEIQIETLTLEQAEALADTLVSNMSPEALTCDGELSRSEVNKRVVLYTGAARALKSMFPSLSPKWDDSGLFTNPVKPAPVITLRAGAQVEINHAKLGGRAVGVILKVNRTRCRVKFAQGTFNVPFGMLQKVSTDLA